MGLLVYHCISILETAMYKAVFFLEVGWGGGESFVLFQPYLPQI